MTTAEYIEYYHGTILGSVNNVYLVHYGDAEAVYYGIGSMVHNRKNDEEYPSFQTDDITNPFWKERLETLQAHPELIAEYVNPKYYDYLIPLPLDESNLAVLTEHIKQNHADWKFQTIYPDFVIVKRTQQIHNDRYAVVTYRELGHFEGGPPLWDKTISKEEAEIFSRDLNAMYAWYEALMAEAEVRRREAAAQYEQHKREHPELYSKKPLSKRKKQRLKKRLARQNPDSTG